MGSFHTETPRSAAFIIHPNIYFKHIQTQINSKCFTEALNLKETSKIHIISTTMQQKSRKKPKQYRFRQKWISMEQMNENRTVIDADAWNLKIASSGDHGGRCRFTAVSAGYCSLVGKSLVLPRILSGLEDQACDHLIWSSSLLSSYLVQQYGIRNSFWSIYNWNQQFQLKCPSDQSTYLFLLHLQV